MVNDLPQEPAGEARGPSERGSAGAGTEPSPRWPHRHRLPSSGPQYFGGFRAPQIAGSPMEAALPTGPGAPPPQAQGAASRVVGLLRRIKGKLFTW